jgi:hypothetical protein
VAKQQGDAQRVPAQHSSYDAVLAYKPANKEARKPESEEQVTLIRTTMRHLEVARTATQMRKARTAEGKQMQEEKNKHKEAAKKAKEAEGELKKAEEAKEKTLRNLCAQALAKPGPYLNTPAPSSIDRLLLATAHEGWRELQAFALDQQDPAKGAHCLCSADNIVRGANSSPR